MLSLKRSVERRQRFEAEAARVGLTFAYCDGIDARDLAHGREAAPVDQDRAQSRYGRRLGPAEIACAEGHRRIWRELLAGNGDAAVVLEDDVSLDDAMPEVLASLQRSGLDPACEPQIVLLGRNLQYSDLPLWLARRHPRQLTDRHRLLRVVKSDGALHGGFGYLVTRAAAEALLAKEPVISIPADAWDLFRQAGALRTVWVLEPPVVLHAQVRTDSLIGPERARIAAELSAAEGQYPGVLGKVLQVATSPRRLARSIRHRVGWQRLKRLAYAWLSRVS